MNDTRISETADRVRSAIGDIKKDKTEKKLKADLKSMAETMLSMSAAMSADKAPSKEQLGQLRMLHGKLGAAIQRYPSPKRKTKAVEMSPAAFQVYAASELQAAISKDDAERVERLEANVDAAREAFGEGQETVTIEIFEEPDQDQVSQNIDQLTKAVNSLSEQLHSVIDKIKPRKPSKPGGFIPGEEEEEEEQGKKPGARKQDQGDGSDDAAADDGEGDGADDASADDAGADDATGDGEGEQDTAKADEGWPRDLNTGREPTPLEKYGTRKSLSDKERSFGPDPD